MRRYIYQAIAIFLLFLPLQGKGQPYLCNYNIKNGLPDNSVNCITQDSNGYIWAGTSNGLARFDGLLFTVFKHNRDDASTIANNNIHTFLANKHGLYFSTDLGVDFYNSGDNTFHHCEFPGQKGYKRIVTMAETSAGMFATDYSGQLYRIEGTTFWNISPKFKVYAVAAMGAPGKAKYIIATANHKLLLLSADAKRTLASATTPFKASTNNVVYYSKRQGRIYAGNGIGSRSVAFKFSGGKLIECADDIPSNLKAVTDFQGGTVFATDGEGMMIRNGSSTRWLTEKHDGICGNALYSIFADNIGNLWVGSYRKGMTLCRRGGTAFNILNEATHTLLFDLVTAVTAGQGNVYVGMDGGGVSVVSAKTHAITATYTAANSGIAGDNVVSMTSDDTYVWMAVYDKGLSRLDTRTHTFTNYKIPLYSNRGDIIWTLCDSRDGNLWVGGRDVLVFDKKSGKFSPVKGLVGCGSQAMSLHGKYMWIGTGNGVYKVDKDSKRIVRHYSQTSKGMALSTNSLRYVYADSKGRVWVSFSYDDICRIDEQKGEVRTYNMAEGLGSNAVTGIVESRQGHMIFSTSNGLYYYFPESETFMRFDMDNNLPATYNYAACHTNGQYYFFGSTEGLVWATDVPVRHGALFSQVSFNALSLANGRNVSLGAAGTKSVKLKHDENYFSIHFSVPEYTSPRAIRFSYYLKGMETEWREMTDSRKAQYTNVPPGDYEFLVRCTDITGKWTKPSVLRITVLPPWYLTWWARGLWIFIFIGLACIGARLYLRELNLRHKMELAEKEKESQRQIDEAKMSFFTSITHELRTPLFLIAAQLEELIDRRQTMVTVPTTCLMAMHRGATKISKLISRAIDFRKMDEGKLVLKRQRINATAFARDLADDYIDLCYQKDITFSTSLPDHPVWVMMDGEKMEMCINNLVSNAYKYTKPKGHVTLGVTETDNDVVFNVKDDGIGIVPEAREKIFKSFYRTERGQAQSQGDGIGLAFVKSLVKLHGGQMLLESEVNEGSTFSIKIPKATQDDRHLQAATSSKPDVQEILPQTDHSESKPKETTTDGNNAPKTSDATNTNNDPKANDAPKTNDSRKSQPKVKSNPTATHSILIIDDEHETVALLERNLVADFHVFKAYDGEEGLKMASEHLPDIILCDLMMPNLDGLGFLRTLKNDKKLKHIKVIIFTGETSEEERIAAYDAGADAYITKPVSLKLLRTRIDRLIAESDNATLTTDTAKDKRTYNKEEQIFLLRCREIIDDNITNPDFNVDFLAQKLAMSHSALYKKLKQMTGMSLIEFVNDYKIFKAVKCFKEGQTNVESVAEQCGFGDVKNFRTLFKRKMQVTPKQFVQSL